MPVRPWSTLFLLRSHHFSISPRGRVLVRPIKEKIPPACGGRGPRDSGAPAPLQRRGHRRLAQCCCIHLTLCEEGSACQSRNHCVCESCSGPDKQAPPGLSAYGNGIGRLACERDWRGNPADEEPQFFKGHGSRVDFLSGPARFDAASAWKDRKLVFSKRQWHLFCLVEQNMPALGRARIHGGKIALKGFLFSFRLLP